MEEKMKIYSCKSNAPALLRRPQVQGKTGLSCATIYKLMAEDKFPKSIPLFGRTVAWSSADIDEWINERIAKAKKKEVM